MARRNRRATATRGEAPTLDPAAAVFNLNALNIALMVGAAALAFAWPFEVMVWSYLIVGPLHALTELSWLHDRKYFTDSKVGPIVFGAAALVCTLPPMLHPQFRSAHPSAILLACFIAALGLVATQRVGARLLLAGIALAGGLLLLGSPSLALVGLLLPTVVHLFVFTGIFILTGAMRARSGSGLLSLAVFGACAIVLLLLPASGAIPPKAGFVGEAAALFGGLNQYLARLFDLGEGQQALLVGMRFLAYITLYHYLNWFSKTRVIGWHAVGTTRLALVGGLWLVSLGAVLVSVRTGIVVAATLSSLHVVLEFPLNWRSFGNIVTLARPVGPTTLRSRA